MNPPIPDRLDRIARAKKRQKVRRKAIKAMKTLTGILEQLKAAKNREKEYALIFKDESVYFDMIKALYWAYDESYLSKLKLFSPENLAEIQAACIWAGLEKPSSKKQLADRHYRTRMIQELEQRKMLDGLKPLTWIHLRILAKKDGNYDRIKKAIEEERARTPKSRVPKIVALQPEN